MTHKIFIFFKGTLYRSCILQKGIFKALKSFVYLLRFRLSSTLSNLWKKNLDKTNWTSLYID